jgi:DNA-binding NtrC family response regulator
MLYMNTALERPKAELSRKNLPICVLDDELDHVELSKTRLERAGFPTFGTTNPEEALKIVRSGGCRVVIADFKMPAMNGLQFLEKAMHCDPGIFVILATGFYSVDSAIEAIKRGAYDYVCKPIDYDRLLKSLDDLADTFSHHLQIRELESKLLDSLLFHGIIGRSPAMLDVFDLAKKISRHYSNVLITGPTGSGKELIAHALHQMSPVANDRFAVCNCSALVDTLLESQLFGHVRGAFTGATDTRPGLFEFANHGTVFLDEIGETSLPMQAKLLRVIQNREIQRVGSPEVIKVDVRMIAATNRDLRAEVVAGRFREDLFYRLSSIELRVPGLAERPEDIPILIQYFIKKYAQTYGKPLQGLTRRAQMTMLQYDWPGNVRELENIISGAAIAASSSTIDVSDLPEQVQRPKRRLAPNSEGWSPLPLDEIRSAHIQRMLDMCKGNRVRTAQMLGIGRTSLYRFLKRGDNSKAAAVKGAA